MNAASFSVPPSGRLVLLTLTLLLRGILILLLFLELLRQFFHGLLQRLPLVSTVQLISSLFESKRHCMS